jgi:hypothetical protein
VEEQLSVVPRPMSLESPRPKITTDAMTQPVHLLRTGTLEIRITADSQHVLCQRFFWEFIAQTIFLRVYIVNRLSEFRLFFALARTHAVP